MFLLVQIHIFLQLIAIIQLILTFHYCFVHFNCDRSFVDLALKLNFVLFNFQLWFDSFSYCLFNFSSSFFNIQFQLLSAVVCFENVNFPVCPGFLGSFCVFQVWPCCCRTCWPAGSAGPGVRSESLWEETLTRRRSRRRSEFFYAN